MYQKEHRRQMGHHVLHQMGQRVLHQIIAPQMVQTHICPLGQIHHQVMVQIGPVGHLEVSTNQNESQKESRKTIRKEYERING